MDAMLGALALGDIGKFFPDNDDKWKNANSVELLKSVNNMIIGQGFTLGNADVTIVLESPRLFPYIERMRTSIAEALGTVVTNISVKATTEERLGFTGDGSGISAFAVVLLNNLKV